MNIPISKYTPAVVPTEAAPRLEGQMAGEAVVAVDVKISCSHDGPTAFLEAVFVVHPIWGPRCMRRVVVVKLTACC